MQDYLKSAHEKGRHGNHIYIMAELLINFSIIKYVSYNFRL